jgi:H+/Cl- antiporter ClcA
MKQQLTIYITLLITASVIAFLANALINRMAKTTNSDNSQGSYLLFKAGIFLAIGYILAGLVIPFMTLWRIIENSNSENMLPRLSEFYVVFIVIAVTLIALNYAVSFILFNIFYGKSKLSFALANNELFGVALFIGLLLLTLFVSKEILPHVIDTIIPYPQTPIYR